MVQAGQVSGGVHFHRAERTGDREVPPKPRQLPADVRGFVNRTEELERLNAVLTGEDGKPLMVQVCVIAGTAGAGKTSLALHWAHQIKDHFPDGQLYVNLRGYDPGEPVTAPQALHRFLVALGVPATGIPADTEAAASLYRSLLADRRMLIVLDNAASLGQVRPLLPGSGACLTIVTSRSRLSGLAIRDGAQRLPLGTLPEHDAVALLRALTTGYRPEDDAGRLAELARLCARLPLALRIAAERAVSRPYLRLEDLIADLRDESALWDALSTGDEDEAEAVRTVFAWSYRALPKDAARLFRLLGLFPGPSFTAAAAAALAGTAPGRVRQLLDSLVGAHLVEQTAPDRFEFHDLLRAYAAEQGRTEEPPEERLGAVRRLAVWYLRTAAAARRESAGGTSLIPEEDPGTGDEEAARPVTFADYDQAVDWIEAEHPGFLPLTRAVREAGFAGLVWRLAEVFWGARAQSVPVTDWLAMGRIGLEAARETGDREAQARLRTALGMACTRAGLPAESAEHHGEALAIHRALGNRQGEGEALNALALARLRGRELGRAEELLTAALGIFRESGEVRWAATVLANLASVHVRAGRLAEGDAAVGAALEVYRARGDRRGEGNALRLLSEIQRERGEPAEAVRSAEAAVEIALGLRNRVLEAYWLLSLGAARLAAGEPEGALEAFQRSSVLHRRLGDRGREGLGWQGAGEVYLALERHAEAAEFYRRAAAAHGEQADRWNRAVALDGLARAVDGKAPETARERWREALGLLDGYGDARAVGLREVIVGRLVSAGPEG
ncbi:ATP-binding protein [Streptomyces aidingensis]|uniref:Tetratricopeptide repeat-containing protein n=1 Tax=Streptomyces aidingensis TaxID=910347 RepID=A0A1I1HH78_9ACTN|nr:tetratricopeptide repeat protein [Streptomyces aidingensis]SFC21328.1 Tetratricopeptide repeat-containing protein [Streptomyces aidingensis]